MQKEGWEQGERRDVTGREVEMQDGKYGAHTAARRGGWRRYGQ